MFKEAIELTQEKLNKLNNIKIMIRYSLDKECLL